MSFVSVVRHSRKKVAQSRRLILVSNRGPLEYSFSPEGSLRSSRTGGGVAIALASIAEKMPITWLAGASSPADGVVARLGSRARLGREGLLKLVHMPEETHQQFYGAFCNPLLWFIQHSMAGMLRPDQTRAGAITAWQRGYVEANRHFARALIEEMDRDERPANVMLHDYHFYLLPAMVRRVRPDLIAQHFVHIPWPDVTQWQVLPSALVREMCLGLLGNDSVVFQTEDSALNFIKTCERYLPGEVGISSCRSSIECGGRRIGVWHNPISVDLLELEDAAASLEVRAHRKALACDDGIKTIVRVDRLDPAKNALGGFQAFRSLLDRRPDLSGKVRFLACLVPSRAGIPEYQAYSEEVLARASEINRRFGTRGWQPIQVFHEQCRERALAALTLYDVLLVNSLADGMNLVCKEGAVLNRRDGVQILSSQAGASRELQHAALVVDPEDIHATSLALEEALALAPNQRKARARALQETVQRHQISDWLRHQFTDLQATVYERESASSSLP